MPILPLLVVFDLDYTLWPFWVDTHVTPPFKRNQSGQVVDFHGRKIKYFEEVPQILEYLKKEGIRIAVASRTSEIDGANQLLNLLKWNKYISFKEIYPGSKVTHFDKIKKDSGISFSDMIFFDDEQRNIRDLEKKGVLSIFVEDGMSMDVLKVGLEKFESQRLKNKKI